MAEIGYSTIGGTTLGAYSGGLVIYTGFVAGSSFSATQIHVYTNSSSFDRSATAGIYSDSSGSPGTKLGDTNAVTVTSTLQWWTFDLDSPVSIVSGTTYWLAIEMDGGWNEYHDTDTITSKFSIDTYSAGTLPTTPTSPTDLASDRKHSIYADGAGGGASAFPWSHYQQMMGG